MNYQDCPHYDELLMVLSEGRDFEDISFEIDEVHNCKDCSQKENGVCTLWISLSLVEGIKPQMNISEAKVTIDTLDEQMEKIALKLVRNLNIKK